MKQIIYVPFTEQYFFINYMGLKLTERKKLCENELKNLIIKLNKSECLHKCSELKIDEKNNINNKDSKELNFFKNIRLKIEDLKGSRPPGF